MRARQKVSRAGVELIKSFEGLRTAAARLPDGRWTLGYGHTFSAREGARVTQEDADALLRFDLLPVVDSINNLVLVPLNQNQFDALVSFCFNIGAENFAQSTVLKRLNEGRFAEAALAMDSWRSAEFNGETYVLAPLIRRRAAEKNLFLTPEEISHQAATLGRPVEDMPAPQPAPVAMPDPSLINPYAAPANQRQVIDLNPQPEGVPVYENPYASVSEPRTNIDIEAAFVRAQEEQKRLEEARQAETLRLETERLEAQRLEFQRLETQRLETQRQAEALAAARAAEAARLREDARLLEQQRLEQARLEQARLEQAKFEQERLEQWRLEQARIEAEQAEAARLASIRAEAVRQEQIRLEQVRLEQARIEAERIEAERVEQVRIAAERQEKERFEREYLEAARLEAERQAAETARAEQARFELERLEQEKRDQEAVQPQLLADDAAEKARKAEAAAALMRLYSPYGGGNLGRPLAGPFPKPASETQPEAQAEPQAAQQPVPLEKVISTPEPSAPVEVEFTNHSVISPSTAESTPFEISSRPETLSAEPEAGSSTVDFSPVGSASTMPAPVITALNPYARPIPAAAVAEVVPAAEAVVEVPRPAPVDLSAPSNAPLAAEIAGLHWRDQLQRPLPQDYEAPQAASKVAEPEQPFLRAGPSSNFQTATYEEDNETWMMNGDRIALSAEETEEEHDSFWQMFVKTFWWFLISCIGLGCLGVATGAWWQATHDLTVMREAKVGFYTFVSISTAALGILFVSTSVWLILKRLGGLKD